MPLALQLNFGPPVGAVRPTPGITALPCKLAVVISPSGRKFSQMLSEKAKTLIEN